MDTTCETDDCSTKTTTSLSYGYTEEKAKGSEANPHFANDASSSSGSILKNLRISPRLSALVMLILILSNFVMYYSRSSLDELDEEISEFLTSRDSSSKLVKGVEEDIRRLHNTLSHLEGISQEREEAATNNAIADSPQNIRTGPNSAWSEVTLLQQKVKALSDNAEHLKAQVQETGRIKVLEKFGSGVHRVEIELAFPDKMEGPNKFVIELAPIDLMPHSVHVFLEMVSAGLFDGCSFILNALHVLKAAPLPYDGSSAAAKAMAFTKHGLESVAFKEYSESYPHTPLTVGFAADGSPGFYINTEDNTEIYTGEPCFGKIVSGFETIRRMEESPTKHGIWLEQRIGIKSARVI